MPIVLTLDQKESRQNPDRIEDWQAEINARFHNHLELEFVRTAGDEMQALTADAKLVVEMVLLGIRRDAWWLGIGLGEIEHPLRETAAASRGSAFYNAREAVVEAKESRYGFAVIGDESERANATSAALTLLANLASRRGARQWEAIDLRQRGYTQKEAAMELRISPQAVSQRLQAAGWEEECAGRWLVEWLLSPLSRKR